MIIIDHAVFFSYAFTDVYYKKIARYRNTRLIYAIILEYGNNDRIKTVYKTT